MRHFLIRKLIMIEFLSHTFLFEGLSFDDIRRLVLEYPFYELTFDKGDVICSSHCGNDRIGFVRSGGCTVSREHSDGSLTPLNTLCENSSFGILSAFTPEDDYPTTVISGRQTSIVFIGRDNLVALMKKEPSISFNVARFLADRVVFLNNKIKTFSSGSVMEKLSCYLASECDNRASTSFFLNVKKTAEILNTGRASLYRSLDSLADEGIISFDNKKITINDLDGLRRKK